MTAAYYGNETGSRQETHTFKLLRPLRRTTGMPFLRKKTLPLSLEQWSIQRTPEWKRSRTSEHLYLQLFKNHLKGNARPFEQHCSRPHLLRVLHYGRTTPKPTGTGLLSLEWRLRQHALVKSKAVPRGPMQSLKESLLQPIKPSQRFCSRSSLYSSTTDTTQSAGKKLPEPSSRTASQTTLRLKHIE